MEKTYKTYIEGFDTHLKGGIPKGHVVLLSGVPGSMKSSLAYNILYYNAKYDKVPGLYITFDVSKKNLETQFGSLGLNDDLSGILTLMDLTTIRENLAQFKGENWLEIFKDYTSRLRYQYNYELLVLDSLQMLELVVKIQNPREEVYRLIGWLRDLNVTSILISEMHQGEEKFSKYEEDILTDGIIHLEMAKIDGETERRIRCIRMRGVPHSTSAFVLKYENFKFKIDTLGTFPQKKGLSF